MAGRGTYTWIGLDGVHGECHHWDDLPEQMLTLVRFEPEIPPGPHSDEDHAIIGTFTDRLREVLARCQR